MTGLVSELTHDLPSTPEGVRRFVNDSIREKAERLLSDPSTIYEFVCECGDLGCRKFIPMTLAQYDRSRERPVLAHA
jgi:hypothetical protein